MVKRKPGQLGRLPKYPWDSWFARKNLFSLLQGKDFDCAPTVMAVYFRSIAKRRKRKVHISIKESSLEIFIEKEANA